MKSGTKNVLLLIKKTPRGNSKNPDLVRDFKKMYKSKNFLDYLARLSANICLDSTTLHKLWSEYPDQSEDGFKKFLKGILKEQQLNPKKFEPKLFQISGKDKISILDVETAKSRVGELSDNQAVWPYIISLKDYKLIAKNKLLGLEDYANFVAPELTKWLKKNFLDIKNLNVFGGVHFDTEHPHIQLWISEKKPTLKHDRTVRFDRRDQFLIGKKELELELEIKLLKGVKKEQNKNLVFDKSQEIEFNQAISDLRKCKTEFLKELKEINLESFKHNKNLEKMFEAKNNMLDKFVNEKLQNHNGLTISQNEIIDIFTRASFAEKKNLLVNSTKYYKYLLPDQKQIIDNFYNQILDNNLVLKSRLQHFNVAIERVKLFEKNDDIYLANKAKNIIKKEKQEIFYSTRNIILKKVTNYYNPGVKTKTSKNKTYYQQWDGLDRKYGQYSSQYYKSYLMYKFKNPLREIKKAFYQPLKPLKDIIDSLVKEQ